MGGEDEFFGQHGIGVGISLGGERSRGWQGGGWDSWDHGGGYELAGDFLIIEIRDEAVIELHEQPHEGVGIEVLDGGEDAADEDDRFFRGAAEELAFEVEIGIDQIGIIGRVTGVIFVSDSFGV